MTTFSSEQILEFEKQVDEAKESLKLKETVLQMAIEANQKSSGLSTTAKPAPIISGSGKINLDDLSLPARQKRERSTQKDDVMGVIEMFGDQVFEINHIRAALDQTGKGFKGKNARNRIFGLVKQLIEDGKVQLKEKGVGNGPNSYQRATTTTKPLEIVKNAD